MIIRLLVLISLLNLPACIFYKDKVQTNSRFAEKQYQNLREKRDVRDIKVTNRDFIFKKHKVIGAINSRICRTAFLNQPITEDDLMQDLQKKAIKLGADAIISFEELKYPSWDENCKKAKGVAVVYKK